MKLTKRRVIIALVIIVVLGASALAAFLLMMQQKATETSQEESQQLVEHPAETTSDEADKLALEGDVNKSVEAYDQAIESTEDSFARFVYYSRKATLLFNNKEYDAALEAAQQAYDIQKTSDSAAFVGQIARAKGDKSLAIERYKDALTLIDSNDPFANEDKSYYEQIIKELESGA